jgi:hypothetical protein
MAKKAKTKIRLTLGNKTRTEEVNLFPPTGHNSYSGFGAHEDKERKAERRNRKIEEKRMRLYGDE